MRFNTIEKIDVKDKNVLCRLDLDVSVKDGKIIDDSRLLGTISTVEYLVERGANNITIIGHRGRPGSATSSVLNMDPVRSWYKNRFPKAMNLIVADNLRFNPGEEANSLEFAQDIVRQYQAQIYVFDAFASHRPHASVVTIPNLLPTAVGFRFEAELNNLNKVLNSPRRPVVFVIGGAKIDTKLPFLVPLARLADKILIGGKFPLFPEKLPKDEAKAKLLVASLTPDGLDITAESAKLFVDTISKAGTVVWNGPVGAYERADKDEGQRPKDEGEYRTTPAWGTYSVAKAVNETRAFTVAGGGDTEAALSAFGFGEGIDWISSGGGAMLHYLSYGTLPFLEALK